MYTYIYDDDDDDGLFDILLKYSNNNVFEEFCHITQSGTEIDRKIPVALREKKMEPKFQSLVQKLSPSFFFRILT